MLRKFLMIGLGGSGGKTLRYLKQNLTTRFEETGWDEGMPEGWQFLHIDTPAQQDSPILPGAPELLDADEYLALSSPGIDFGAIIEGLKDKGEDLSGWMVDPRYMNIPIAMGAGQYRSVGRIIGLYYTDRIKNHLLNKQRSLMTSGAAAQMDRLADRFNGGNHISAETPPPAAIIISSLAGGTGAGILTDVCDILRSDGAKWMDESIGILYAADVFNELSTAASASIQPNTAAAVAELLHGYFGDGAFVPPGGGALQQRSGPAFPYLVGHSNTKGVTFGDQMEVYRFMARCLSAVMSDRRIQDDFTVYMTANWQSSAGKFAARPDSWMLPPPRYRGAIQALGFAEVDLGVGRLRTYAEQRITRDAAEWLLEGHRAAVENNPEYENSTPQQIIEALADRSFTRFLNDCGLNERGRENNQILDAVAIPDNTLKERCLNLANHIHEICRDNKGSKAHVSELVDLIVAEIETRRVGMMQQMETLLREACRKWVEQTPGRIVETLGESIAEQGIQISLKLLDKTIAEMEHVKGELHSERQEELTLTEYLRSDVSDAIGATSGKLSVESECVRKAIQKAVQTGIIHRYNAEHRELGSLLADDLRQGILEPISAELKDTISVLKSDEETDGRADGSIPIKEWPRHEPQSDRGVPDALEPGKSVQVVIDTGRFPDLFDDLTIRSTGIKEIEAAYRVVRKKVITGGADQTNSEQWIKINAKWSPREWLTVDEPPSPASFTVKLKRGHLLERTRYWLRNEGAWNDYLKQGLRDYLSDNLPTAERLQREEQFRGALDAAFEASEPLASIDLDMLTRVHPDVTMDYRPYTSPIPVAGLPVEESIREFLIDRFKDTQTNYQEEVEEILSQSEKATRVVIHTSLGSALHPMVFKSLNKPIAEAWEKAYSTSTLTNFWEARRSRHLGIAVPVPRPVLQAMIRGWFIGRVLNLIDIGEGETVLTAPEGPFGFKSMLPALGRRPVDFLASMLESLPLAIPVAVHKRQPEKYLRAYTLLIGWGTESGSTDVDYFRWPSPVLEEWLDHGTCQGGRRPVIDGPDRQSRRDAAEKLLRAETDAYRRQAVEDRAGDVTARNAWLGIAELIAKALTEITGCLESDKSGRPTI